MSYRAPDFAPNVDWVTPQSSAYTPQQMSTDLRLTIAGLLICNDRAIELMGQSMTEPHLLIVKVGKRTLHLNVYRESDLKKHGRQTALSHSLVGEDYVIYRIGPGFLTLIHHESEHTDTLARARQCYPVQYAYRHLRLSEIRDIQRRVTQEHELASVT